MERRAAPPGTNRPPLTKDTVLCISLASRPSNIGTRFHNFLYDALGLDFLYKAFSTDDIAAAIGGVRALGIRGCSVSMPFKRDVLSLVDGVEASAAAIDAANTIVNEGGVLTASNTDYLAVQQLVDDARLDPERSVLIRGSGGMARAVAAALRDRGFGDGTVAARTEDAGRRLADSCGYRWQPEPRHRASVLVNATPLGMAGPEADQQAFPDDLVAAADLVFDVVAVPADTPLIRAARRLGRPVITGTEMIALQAAEQFARYTGIRPTGEQIAAAAEHSRRVTP